MNNNQQNHQQSSQQNYQLKILLWTLSLSVLLFISSWCSSVYNLHFKALDNINLFSDIIVKKDTVAKKPKTLPVVVVQPNNNKTFSLFQAANRFTAYYVDSNKVVLEHFMGKLKELKLGKKRKIRIAFIGDSMIEGDMISQTLRQLLQQQFGGDGVGFVPIMSNVAGMRSSVTLKFGNWNQEDFRTKKNKYPLFISGYAYTAKGNSWCELNDKCVNNSNVRLNKYLLTGSGAFCTATVNTGKLININADRPFNKILLDSSNATSIKVALSNNSIPVYGIASESDNGIIIDNYSFRGSGGLELGKMNADFLQTIQQQHPYDLVILQYGVNLLNNANEDNFIWYYKPMMKTIEQVKNNFQGADILLISSADKAFRYKGKYETAKGMFGLISMQQKIAYESGIAFYNLYESMGGEGSMTRWVESNPPLAYKDYTHPNSLGDEIIGKGLFEAFMVEFQKETSIKSK